MESLMSKTMMNSFLLQFEEEMCRRAGKMEIGAGL